RRTLAHDPLQRFASAAEMFEALVAIDPHTIPRLTDDDLQRRALVNPRKANASDVDLGIDEAELALMRFEPEGDTITGSTLQPGRLGEDATNPSLEVQSVSEPSVLSTGEHPTPRNASGGTGQHLAEPKRSLAPLHDNPTLSLTQERAAAQQAIAPATTNIDAASTDEPTSSPTAQYPPSAVDAASAQETVPPASELAYLPTDAAPIEAAPVEAAQKRSKADRSTAKTPAEAASAQISTSLPTGGPVTPAVAAAQVSTKAAYADTQESALPSSGDVAVAEATATDKSVASVTETPSPGDGDIAQYAPPTLEKHVDTATKVASIAPTARSTRGQVALAIAALCALLVVGFVVFSFTATRPAERAVVSQDVQTTQSSLSALTTPPPPLNSVGPDEPSSTPKRDAQPAAVDGSPKPSTPATATPLEERKAPSPAAPITVSLKLSPPDATVDLPKKGITLETTADGVALSIKPEMLHVPWEARIFSPRHQDAMLRLERMDGAKDALGVSVGQRNGKQWVWKPPQRLEANASGH
ncbi:MAG: hypothetical protein AAFS10_27230, partial [Myxococcota bacterium]